MTDGRSGGPGLQVTDAHVHLHRDHLHAAEVRGHLLGRPVEDPPPSQSGTLADLGDMMSRQGVARANVLMSTLAGRYYREGQYVLPDEPRDLERAEVELRARVVRRLRDNNRWMLRVVRSDPRLTFFAGVAPMLMGADELVAEAEAMLDSGASGIVVNLADLQLSADHPCLWPLLDHLHARGAGLALELGCAGGVASLVGLDRLLSRFGGMRILLTGLAPAERAGGTWLGELVHLVGAHPGAHFDTAGLSLLASQGVLGKEDILDVLRRVGIDRVIHGTGFSHCEFLAHPSDADASARTGARQAGRALELLGLLGLSDDELEQITHRNFASFAGRPMPVATISAQTMTEDPVTTTPTAAPSREPQRVGRP